MNASFDRTALNTESAIDDISSVCIDSPTHPSEGESQVNCARIWDPRTFHTLHQQSSTSQSGRASSCHNMTCSCGTHGRHQRRSTTRIRPTRNRFMSHRYYPTYGSNTTGYVNGVKHTSNIRQSSFHGMRSTALVQIQQEHVREEARQQRHSVSTVDEQMTTSRV